MSIIVQSGHKSSTSNKLIQKMYENGLQKPLNSYHSNLDTHQVVDKLSKILVDHTYSDSKHSKLADNLVTELLLANIDHTDWGWESDKNLNLIPYLENYDSDIRFVFVFDSPFYLFGEILQNDTIDTNIIEDMVQEWTNYHKKLITFYHKYQNKSILLQGEIAINNLNSLTHSFKTISDTFTLNHCNLEVVNNTFGDSLEAKLQKDIISRFPLLNQTYETLKVIADTHSYSQVDTNTFDHSLEDLFHDLKAAQANPEPMSSLSQKPQNNSLVNSTQKIEIQRLTEENTALLTQLQNLQEQAESEFGKNTQTNINQELLIENQQLLEQVFNLQEACDNSKLIVNTDNQTLLAENQVLLEQVFSLQEAHEHSNLIANTDTKTNELDETKQLLQNALQYINKKESENELLIGQLQQLQESYETLYATKNTTPMVVVEHPAKLYGAAERVKQDLPYRLGSTMIKNSKSAGDVVKLPIALVKEYQEYHTDLLNNKLPDMEQYVDKEEAEKVKKHLSYKLGKMLVDNIKEREQISKLPKKIGKEILEFKILKKD